MADTGSQERDRALMRRALRLAARGLGRVSPNPAVGAVVVRRGRVVGEGFHAVCGGPHAEVVALGAAGRLADGATLYVTLEPCNHHGRTPPCTEAILQAGVRRVVVAVRDPNPRVPGGGIERLRAEGVAVTEGVLQAEAARVNEAFFKWAGTGLPFVTLKAAVTLDGKIATRTGTSRWITGEASRRFVHRLRDRADAILTGIGTVLADDPLLSVRLGRAGAKRQPLKVVVDSEARTPTNARLLSGESPGRTIIATTTRAPRRRQEALEAAGACVWELPERDGRVDLGALARRLGEEGVLSVLMEAGGTLAAGALEAGLVDRCIFLVAPLILGGKRAPTAVEGKGIARIADAVRLSRMTSRRVGEDLLIEAYLCSPASSKRSAS
jgi:diaminohydroxyphosphoribosylaminopyrimidine deaminase/5-amino-6-(5-phosphoribosylamino)uracil reductase